jgi:hypothetical protein
MMDISMVVLRLVIAMLVIMLQLRYNCQTVECMCPH